MTQGKFRQMESALSKWEELKRQDFNEGRGFVEVNKMISYHISNGNAIFLHVPPNLTTPKEKRFPLLVSGLRDIAKVLEKDEKIKSVKAISTLVANEKWSRILEGAGFLVSDVPDKVKEKIFPGEKLPVKQASCSREKFLGRYSDSSDAAQ